MNCKTSNFPSTDYHYYIYKRELVEREREERDMHRERVSRKT